MTRPLNRREVLLGAGALAAVGLAACSDGSGTGATTTVPGQDAASSVAPAAANAGGGKGNKANNGNKANKGGGKGGGGKDALADAGPAPADPALVAPVLFARPTPTAVVANVLAAEDLDIGVEYGPVGGPTRRSALQRAAARTPLEVTLDGLEPGTTYAVRLRHGDVVGPEQRVTTPRRAGQAFRFSLQGDSHPERVGRQFEAARYEHTLRRAAASGVDFHVCIGDDFSVDTLRTVDAGIVESLYVRQRRWLGLVGAPVFLVNGNHEQAAAVNLDGTPDNVAVWAQNARNRLFSPPAPDGFYTGDPDQVRYIGRLRDYYSFTWGDAQFVVIDPYWHSSVAVDNVYDAATDGGKKVARDLWGITLGETQYRWFRSTLEQSTAAHLFVLAHHVNGTGRGGVELARSYEWGDAAAFATKRPGWGKPIHQVMADAKVSVFFQGHDHLYARQELDGVVYQTLPQPGSPSRTTIENKSAYRSGITLPNTGFVRVGVDARQTVVEYVRTDPGRDDEIAHSYTVAARR